MTFALHVDAGRWRRHASDTRDTIRGAIRGGETGPRLGDIVPVAKGNGYGFGNQRLAVESQRLGADVIAVGTAFEVDAVASTFAGDILVLQPRDPRDTLADSTWLALERGPVADRLIRVVAGVETLRSLAADVMERASGEPIRVLLEGLTSMRRFGLGEPDLDALLADDLIRRALRSGRLRLAGLTLHLPLEQPLAPHVETLAREWHDPESAPVLPGNASGRVREAWSWALTWVRALAALEDAGVPLPAEAASLWVSHLDEAELAALRTALPDMTIRLRLGSRLWLGDPLALSARGTVLAVHQVAKGRAVGYRQRRAPRDGLLVVIGGGTSHGVALSAPNPTTSVRRRLVSAATGALEAAGRYRSPFFWAGIQPWFAEPPHAQMSLVWIPADDLRRAVAGSHQAPGVGDEWECQIRNTTASFDRVVGLGEDR